MRFESVFLEIVDGGALLNGAENRGYGSYQLGRDD